jgi:MFS transporter, AAHS family, 3-hydroxyphenylpropionic acid transporter
MSTSTPIQGVSAVGTSSRLTIVLCFAVAVLEGFDIQALGVAAPKLAPELGLAPDRMGLIFTFSNIGLVVASLFGGWLADRIGRKPVFIGAVITFGLFTLATPFVKTFEHLFFLRLMAGLGFGAALPNMMAVAAEISRPEKRASTAAAMFCGMPVGGGSSALLTQLLPPDFDWRILFYVGGALPLLLAPLMIWLMPETFRRPEKNARRENFVDALFAEGRAAPTLLLWITFFPTLLILYLLLSWLPTLVTGSGLSAATAPQASLAFNFASVVGALMLGRVVDRLGGRLPLTAAFVMLIASLFFLSTARDVTTILVCSALAGFSLLGANYALYGVAASYYPQRVRGLGSGASIAVGRVGSVVGPFVAGMLLASGKTAADVIMYLVPVAAVAGIAVFALGFFKPNTSAE